MTIVKDSKLWVELNIPETPGGETPTRDELAEKVGIDPIVLSKALEPFDQAMGKHRRPGAPLGKNVCEGLRTNANKPPIRSWDYPLVQIYPAKY